MYESPITQILGEMQVTYENGCLKAVQSYGFDVNKEELTKALQYDRGQYDKGYKDGYEKALNALADKSKMVFNSPVMLRVIDELVETVRGGR